MARLTFIFVLACLALASAFAFVPSTNAVVRSQTVERTAVLTMASRTNAKKDKRQRNRDNMRKFSKPVARGPRGKESQKSSALMAKRATAKQKEAEFVAKLFQHVSFSEEES